MTELKDVVCPFCGCLCDDLVISITENRITKNKNGCSISRTKFLNHLEDRIVNPIIRVDDSKVE
ncbi:MAG: formylmethanofuran dehydrogenase subunit B, partial [Candidatus Thorarchaeota archaeon]|nr:formylmethanofuran dehydrogenase subunit B [Candidatus Thorarchaeota archaeon]